MSDSQVPSQVQPVDFIGEGLELQMVEVRSKYSSIEFANLTFTITVTRTSKKLRKKLVFIVRN